MARSIDKIDNDVNMLVTNVRQIDYIHGSWYTTKTADFTIGNLDHYAVYGIETDVNALVATLPTPANNEGRAITFIKTDSGAGTLQVTDLLSTWTSLYLINQYDTLTIRSDGSAWNVISGKIQPVATEADIGGGFHLHEYTIYNNVGLNTGNYTINLLPASLNQIPNGAKQIRYSGFYQSGTLSARVYIRSKTGNIVSSDTYLQNASSVASLNGDVVHDSTGIDIGVAVATVTITLYCHGYYI